jgi:hypothetical protein
MADIAREYIRRFINESRKMMEENGYKYAYSDEDLADADEGWVVSDSLEELEEDWDDNDTEFDPDNVLVLKPATSLSGAMVLFQLGGVGDFIHPSIKSAINHITEMEKEVDNENLTDDILAEIKELKTTKDFARAKELMSDVLGLYGSFEGFYTYVSGPKPDQSGNLKISGKNFGKVPADADADYYINRIQKDPKFGLEHVPEKFRTPEVCKAAVEIYDWALKDVPEKFITPELCKIAVEHSGYALRYVPEKFITPELCKIAIENNIDSLRYIPKKFLTSELFKNALQNSTSENAVRIVFGYAPDEIKTPEICKIALKKAAYIRDVPEKLITPELCKIAVENNIWNFENVPDKFKTLEICKIALEKAEKSPFGADLAIEHMPKDIRKQLGY